MIEPVTIAIALAVLAILALSVVTYQSWLKRKEMEAKLEASQALMKSELQLTRNERDTLLDALNDVFLIIDEAHIISYANSAALRLFNSKSLAGRHIRETFVDSRLSKAIGECLQSDKAHQSQISIAPRRASSDGGEAPVMEQWVIDSAPMITIDGVSPATRVVMRNVSQEHQTEQIRKDFVANASHELRTPMAIIHGYLENLLEDDLLEEPETCRKFLGIMRKHSDRMSRIIEDMLVISKLESGEESSLKIDAFGLKECLQDILERLESLIRSQQASVELNLADQSIQVHGDRFYWTQALFNLIENALKQNPRPGLKIEVGSKIDEGRLLIWVSDDGIGIPSADLPFVFRRFYRVEKHHNQSEVKGTGLGLSIVKRAIEAHHGSIQVSSTPGTETKFLIKVPLDGPKSTVTTELAEAEKS